MTGPSDDNKKSGQVSPQIIHSHAPHVVSFNEKTGKAQRPAHVNATEKASHGNVAPPLAESATQLPTERIIRAEAESALQTLVTADAQAPSPNQLRTEQWGPDSNAANIVTRGKSDQEGTSVILGVDGHPGPANLLLETKGTEINHSGSPLLPVAEASRHLPKAPQEVMSIISAPGLDDAKRDDHTAFPNSNVITEQFESSHAHPPSEARIDIPVTTQATSAALLSGSDAVTGDNVQIIHESALRVPDDNAAMKDPSALRESASAKASAKVPSGMGVGEGVDVPAERSTPGTMHISLSATSMEKLAKETQSSQELSQKLDALAKRMSTGKNKGITQ